MHVTIWIFCKSNPKQLLKMTMELILSFNTFMSGKVNVDCPEAIRHPHAYRNAV